jgi:diphosphomevalonate decarboxylase
MSEQYFFQKASFLARLGSGSACRSVKGSVVFGKQNNINSDLFEWNFQIQYMPIQKLPGYHFTS